MLAQQGDSHQLVVLCAHNIVRHSILSCWDVTEQQIESIIEWYRHAGYNFVTLDGPWPDSFLSVVLTLDDGRSGAVSWLQRRAHILDLTATVFVVPGWIDDEGSIPASECYSSFARWGEIAALRDAGHSVGSHSMSHVRLPKLDEPSIRHELGLSKIRIYEMLGEHARHFAAPYGKLNTEVVKIAAELGYKSVSSTEPGVNGIAELQSGILKRFVLRGDLPDLGIPGAGV